MLKRAVLYFAAGAIEDGLVTLYYLAVDTRAVLAAAFISALITIIALALINNLISKQNLNKNKWLLIAIYALGNGAGTALAMILK